VSRADGCPARPGGEKERGLEPLEAYLSYPRTTPDGFFRWAEKAGLPFFHFVARSGSQER
jgi:hypothetical protein